MTVGLQGDGSEPTAAVTSEQPGGPQLVIWGTNVVVSEAKDKFTRFILRFIDPETEEADGIDPNEPLYLQKLDEV